MTSVLVIDDDPMVRELVCRWGHAAKYVVTEAATVAEAVVRIGAVAPVVVLCDVRLPDGDGRDFSTLVRQHCPHAALILMSGLGADASSSCLGSGAIGYLAKPFDRRQLLAAVELGENWNFDRVAAALSEQSPRRAATT
jgi:CheY-like chemotaxis protein